MVTKELNLISRFSEVPFVYEECRLDHSLGVGKDSVTGENPTIPDASIWASSHTTTRRAPHMARLDDPTGMCIRLKGENKCKNSTCLLCIKYVKNQGTNLLQNNLILLIIVYGKSGKDITDFQTFYSPYSFKYLSG